MMRWVRLVLLMLVILGLVSVAGVTSSLTVVVSSGSDMVNLLDPLVYESLVHYRDAEPTPWLATDWEIDGVVWTFYLRQDVCFHDGRPLTAWDVASSIAGLEEGQTLVQVPNIGITAKIIDDYSLRLIFESPNPTVLESLSRMPILPQGAISGSPTDETPPGTGPYTVQGGSSGDNIVLKRYEAYWGAPPPFDTIKASVVPEEAKRYFMVKSGEADLALDLSFKHYEEAKASSAFTPLQVGSPSYLGLFFNLGAEPFSDLRVRKAISCAVDYEEIINQIYMGFAMPCSGPIHPAQLLVTPEPSTRDPERAEALLREAGWSRNDGGWEKDGKELTFSIIVPSTVTSWTDVAMMIKANLEEVGVRSELMILPPSAYYEKLYGGGFDAALASMWADLLVPDLSPWVSDSPNNFTGYESNTVDAIFGELATEMDTDIRSQLLKDAHLVIAVDAPCAWLAYPETLNIARGDLAVFPTQFNIGIGPNCDNLVFFSWPIFQGKYWTCVAQCLADVISDNPTIAVRCAKTCEWCSADPSMVNCAACIACIGSVYCLWKCLK